MPSQSKPSDFSQFALTVFTASATLMDFQDYFEVYGDVLRVLFFNPDIDQPLAIAKGQKKIIAGKH